MKKSIGEDVEIDTVDHPVRTAAVFALIVYGAIAFGCWLTGTKRGWLVLALALLAGVGLWIAFHFHGGVR